MFGVRRLRYKASSHVPNTRAFCIKAGVARTTSKVNDFMKEEMNMDNKIEELRENLGRMAALKKKYGLTASSVEKYIKDTEHFQVVTPLIGEFSTGKSSLINSLLERKVLGEGIEPKTAVPTEICYGAQ